MINASGTTVWEGFQSDNMQTMDMGTAEARLTTQLSAIPSGSSSSYFLQLDPSGQVDILESSLVLNKPEMADETVYEIQLDPYMMDERNLEVINLQNLQNTVTFQPQFLEEHQFATASFDNTEVHYQVDDFNLSQILLNNASVIPASATTTEVVAETYEDEIVPEFTYETEIATESEQAASIADNASHHNQHLQYIPFVSSEWEATGVSETTLNIKSADDVAISSSMSQEIKTEIASDEEQEDMSYKEEGNTVQKDEMCVGTGNQIDAKSVISYKRVKRELPDNIMEFTEEAVIPPVSEIFPTPNASDPVPPPVVTICDDEDNDDDDDDNSVDANPPLKPKFLYDGMDHDDELYISFLSRPAPEKTAMCILCYDWFDNMHSLEEHLKSVHQDNMILYGCKRCGKQFWSRFGRQRHEKQHRYDLKAPIERYMPKNRPFDHYESKHFYKRLRPAPFTQQYRDHLKLLHSQIKSTEYDCFDCDKKFHTEEEYREHYEEEHTVQTCVHCRKQLGNLKLLRKHEQDVHGKYSVNKNYPGGAWKLWKTWECEEMNEKDERLVNLFLFHNYTKRLKSEQSSSEEIPASTCTSFSEFACEEVTEAEYEAAKNIEKRAEEKEEKFEVKKVKKEKKSSHSENTKSRKSDHKPPASKLQDFDKIEFIEEPSTEQAAKRTDLPYKCGTCQTSFDNDTDLQRHVKSHTIRSMAYMCQYCGRGFATHSNRKEHERIHTGDKPYVCPICSRAFVQISNLKKHIQTHKDKNNLQCSTCNKQFVKESSLILHQRAHSQDRKFRCHICDRAYNYASLLKRHMRIHTGENPYSCDDCGMQFHELVSLHYHRKKVHTGERPHRCDQCGRAFILSSDLKKHLKIHLRDGASIKSSGTSSPNAKSKSGSSKSSVLIESVPANANGAIVDTLVPPMDEPEMTTGDINFNNSPLMEFQTDESVEMPEHTVTDRILVISETDLLNVTRNGTTDGNSQSEPTTVPTDPENDLSKLYNTEAVP